MRIGSIGSVTFTVSSKDVFTHRGMERKRVIAFGEHAVMEGKPRLQHTGRKLDTISLPIVMDGQLKGAVPCETRIQSLLDMADTGEEQDLVFGSTYYGQWVVMDVAITARVMHGEKIIRADVTLNLTEYN